MFALLEHAAPEGIHWDFIIEVADRALLPTWRLAECPLKTSGAVSAEPIAEHPPHFLEYEGALRPGLGLVRRLDRGEATVLEFGPDGLRAELFGDRLRGHVEIFASDGIQTNRFSFTPRERV